jgi:hypothetical protein
VRSDPAKPALRAWSDEIDHLLEEQLGRIRRRFLIHGLGWLTAAAAAAVFAYFLLDLGLELPRAVRILMTAGLAVYLGFGLRRRVLYPLRRAFGRGDVAIAIERRFPELREQLITAFELKGALAPDAAPEALRSQSAAMVERVVHEASTRARALPLDSVLSPRRTARVWAVAGAALAALTIAVVLQAAQFSVFVARAAGLGLEYPRRTRLFVELPDGEAGFRIVRRDGIAEVTMSTGADLPVLVRAEGLVPREVQLVVQGGRGMPAEITMAQRPGERFRHVFRRVQAGFGFHARGGDDPRGDLEVVVRTVDPPLVGTIEAEVDFPAYTGRPPARVRGGAIEALVGSEVRIQVTATTPVARAALRFLDSAAVLELEPTRIDDDSGAGRVFAGRFAITATDRYQVELTNADGLGNPRPGTYPVIALEDLAPVGRVLLPSGDEVQVVLPTARLPVRVEARDDFGLAWLGVEASTGRSENATTEVLFDRERDGPRGEFVTTVILDVDALEPGDGPRQGDVIGLGFAVRDNREPEAARTDLSKRQVHVVDGPDLARRISGHFRRVRDQVERALDQERGLGDGLEALLEDLPDPREGRDPRLVGLQVGQARVVAAVRRIRDDLMRAYDLHLFNGLEGTDSIHAPRVVELYATYHRENPVAEAFVPGFYRLVGEAQASGRIGPMEKSLDPILGMVLRADRIVEGDGAAAVEALDAAAIAAEAVRLGEIVQAVLERQRRVSAALELLLGQLDEWNEFQDVVQQARALRDAQKDIEYRTRTLDTPGGERR